MKTENKRMKEKMKFNGPVQETLLIPLYMRAMESRRKKNCILKDDFAEGLVDRIDYDFAKLKNAKMSYIGCVVRGRYYDDAARRFIQSHSNPVVVNVGCGLDTRYQRVKEHNRAVFYELDLPEVIELRRHLIPEEAGDHYVAGSLLEEDWMDELRERHPDSHFIIIAEGVLMYFYERQVRQFVTRIAKKFGGGELCFDVCGPMMTKHGVRPDSMQESQAEFRSDFANGHEIEKWACNIQLVEQKSYMSMFRSRWGFMGYTFGLFPRLCFRYSSMLRFKLV